MKKHLIPFVPISKMRKLVEERPGLPQTISLSSESQGGRYSGKMKGLQRGQAACSGTGNRGGCMSGACNAEAYYQ